jgi:prepilin-type N-terminal cleavage/methylation domain-containing protein
VAFNMTRPAPARSQEAGFTLVEMAIVIAIAGIIVTFVVSALGGSTQVRRESQSRDKMEIIAKAIGNRIIQNLGAPCPSDPAVAQTAATFGQARAACASAALSEGLVPFQSLGLPVEMAKDGWGRFMTYRTSPSVATAITKAAACTATRAGTDVNVNDQNGNPVVAATVVHGAVVISHGANGFGAFLVNGTANRAGGTAADANETTNQTTGSANKIAGVPNSAGYDDITLWRTVPALVTVFNQTCP